MSFVSDKIFNLFFQNRNYPVSLQNKVKDAIDDVVKDGVLSVPSSLWNGVSSAFSNFSFDEGAKDSIKTIRKSLINSITNNKSVALDVIKYELTSAYKLPREDVNLFVDKMISDKSDFKYVLNQIFPSAERVLNGDLRINKQDCYRVLSDLSKEKPEVLREILSIKYPAFNQKLEKALGKFPPKTQRILNGKINEVIANSLSPEVIRQVIDSKSDKTAVMNILSKSVDNSLIDCLTNSIFKFDTMLGLKNILSFNSGKKYSTASNIRNLLIQVGINEKVVNSQLDDAFVRRLLGDKKQMKQFLRGFIPSLSELQKKSVQPSQLMQQMNVNFAKTVSFMKKNHVEPEKPKGNFFRFWGAINR